MRRLLLLLGLPMVVVTAWALGYMSSGGPTVSDLTPRVSEGVNIYLDLMAIEPSNNRVVVRAKFVPDGRYLNTADDSFAVPLRVTCRYELMQTSSFDIAAGQPVGRSYEFQLPVDGSVQNYPLDRYDFSDAGPENLSALRPAALLTINQIEPGGALRPVPVAPWGVPGGIPGWDQTWRLVADGSTLKAELLMTRSSGVLGFVALMVLLVVAAAILSAVVAWAVATQRWRVRTPSAGWYAMLLAALIPLRTLLPAAPPIGSWIDIYVFFWVEIVLLSAMGVFVATMFRLHDGSGEGVGGRHAVAGNLGRGRDSQDLQVQGEP